LSSPWQPVKSWSTGIPSGAGNCTPAGSNTRVVNVSTSAVDALALATTLRKGNNGVTTFALSYGVNASEASQRAASAVAGVDVGATMQERNDFVLRSAEPLPDASDDRFQRKLLSVMKVNSMSPEGAIAHNWSTTCRAPHKWMYGNALPSLRLFPSLHLFPSLRLFPSFATPSSDIHLSM
jgi:hypothetical protein